MSVNELNSPIKRHSLAEWVKQQQQSKTRSHEVLSVKLTLDLKTHRLRMKGKEKIFQSNCNQNKAQVAIFIQMIEFKLKVIKIKT